MLEGVRALQAMDEKEGRSYLAITTTFLSLLLGASVLSGSTSLSGAFLIPDWISIIALAVLGLFAPKRRALLPSITVLAAVLALVPGWRFQPALAKSEVYPMSTSIRKLVQERDRDPDLRVFAVDGGVFDRNSLLSYGLQQALGTDGMDPERYVFMLVHLLRDGQLDLPRPEWSTSALKLDSPLFEQLAARIVVTRKGELVPEHFRLLHENAQIRIYENPRAAPRAQLFTKAFLFDANDRYRLLRMPHDQAIMLEGKEVPRLEGPLMQKGSVSFVKRGANQLELESKSDGAAWLLLRDNFHPAWKAMIDGKPAKIHRANFSFRAVQIPKGEHKIHFYFAFTAWTTGVFFGFLGMFILLTLLVLDRVLLATPRTGFPAPTASRCHS